MYQTISLPTHFNQCLSIWDSKFDVLRTFLKILNEILAYFPYFERIKEGLGYVVAQWLRHSATNQKVGGSISDEMIF
jgi:hypothetical protein